MYNPVIFYNTAKRIGQPPGSSEQPALFAPVIFDNKIAGDIPSGASVLWLDACGQPCAPDNAMYVVYPQGYAPPAGFSFAWGAGEMAPSYWAQQFQYPPNILGGSPASKVANALPASSKEGKPTTAESPHTTAPADAEAEVFTLVEGESGYHVQSSRSKKLEPATNFLIRISRVVHIVHADHEHDEREIELQITVFAGTMLNRSLTLPYEKIKDILSYIQQKIGEAIIFSSVKVAFLNRFPEHFRQKLAIAPHQYFIESSGWNRLPGGSFAYVHDAAVPRERNVLYRTDFSIPNAQLLLSPADALQNAWKMLRLASKPAKILIPFLFAHLGCMWSLFSEAGYPPRTILFIRGTTGSLKTAVASLLFNFSAIPENNVPATFRDTSASMEVKMGQFRDRVLLVDDFCPAASGASQKVMQQALEQLIRFYGDGIGRSRTDPRLKDTHEIKPHGLCAITGEDSSGSYSSLLRCLFLSVDRNTYDKQLLAWFQKDPRQWTSHIAHFIAACEAHWSEIVSFIHSAFPEVRRQAEGLLSERRLIDTCACLVLTARIFMNYSASLIPQLSNDERTQRLTDMINLIVEVCRESEHRSQEIDPAKTFASIFLNAVRREEVKIGSVQEAENAKSEFLGVAHDQYWYLWPDGTYQAVVRAFQREGGHFPLTQRALWEALVNAGVLLPAVEHSKGPGRVAYGTRVSFLGRPRLLRIDPKRLHELENDS